VFERDFHVAWAHLDANGHMANTAYLDIVVDVRFMYFQSCGFGPAEFRGHGIGPVVRSDQVDYFKELHLLDAFKVTLGCAGLSEDGSRFRIRNEILRADGQLAARITSLGGWFDLKARKLIAPPEGLANAMRGLEQTSDFEVLKSSVT
jgi:acyl-CoA thioester hydrolase